MADQPLSDDANQTSYGTNAGGPPNAGGAPSSSRKMQATKAQVDEVVDIMRTNVEAVLERDAKISMMDDRADALHQGASQFETQAAKLKNKFWLENMKYMIALGVVVLIFVAVAVYRYKDTAAEAFNAVKGATGGGGGEGAPAPVQPMMTQPPGPGGFIGDNGQIGGQQQVQPQVMNPVVQAPQQPVPLAPVQTPEQTVPQASPISAGQISVDEANSQQTGVAAPAG